MLTKLGKLLAPRVMPYPSATSSESGTASALRASIKAKNYEGTLYAVAPTSRQNSRDYNTSALTNNFYGIKLGSGNSAESEESYTLDSPINSGLSVSRTPQADSVSYEYDSENNANVVYLLYTVTNTSSESITINEIGLFSTFYTASDIREPLGGSSSTKSFLIDRTVLDTPLTLAPNDSAVIKYAFSIVGSEI